jgi:ornithine cyclodeaminase
MLVLNREAVAASLSHRDCIDALEPTMRAVSAGETIMPLRQYMTIPGTRTKFTLMPGFTEQPRCFGVKIVSKPERAPGAAGDSHIGAVMVFAADEARPVALLDGAELTAIRTAAASALATRELARQDARRLAIMGCGVQARHHVAALLQVRPVDHIVAWGRDQARTDAFLAALEVPAGVTVAAADSVAAACAEADIVTTVTSSKEPILRGDWLRPGTHVNLVGAAVREAAEADAETVRRARFFVDYRASAMAQAGELLDALAQDIVGEDHIAGEIGEVLDGRVAGRQSADEITVYKSLGVAAQDLAAGWQAWQQAHAQALGVEVDWS